MDAPSSVRRVWSVPSAFIRCISWPPSRWLAKTILLPSGEKAGNASLVVLSVRRTTFEPSESIV